MSNNPFLVKGYLSSDLFCDRHNETEELLSNVKNGVDTTLISPRKYGKTGLLLHLFDYIEQQGEPFETLYVDIFSSRSLKDFINILAEGILQKFPEKSSIGERFVNLLRGFRPLISYDPFSGLPQVQFNYQMDSEKEYTLKGLFDFLNTQNVQLILAIDEFQQINEYPEKNAEALLRTYIQQLHNVRFIFCGSKRSIMTEMFLNAKRPFFSSTRVLSLERIDVEEYKSFIIRLFEKNNICISPDVALYILEWTKRHTFYTQSLCNYIYAMHPAEVTFDVVKEACAKILDNMSSTYLQYREMLTTTQWNFLIAIAKEDEVTQLTSNKFLSAYHIGTTSARRMAKSLIEKELLLDVFSKGEKVYRIYDVFFSKWLDREYL